MKEKSSIITIVGSYYPLETGFSSAFQNLEKAILKEKSVEKVYVLAPHYSENPNIDGLEYYKMKKGKYERVIKGLFYIGMPDKLPLMLYKNRFREYKEIIDNIIIKSDVKFFLVESMFFAWLVPYLEKNFNIPVMVRIHGTGPENTKYLKEPLTNMNKALLKWTFASKCVSATTSYYFDFFQTYWNDYNHFMNKYFFVIPNTTDIKYKKHIEKEHIVFIQLGRMDKQGYHQKGFTDTILALLFLEQQMSKEILNKVKYISIGSGENETEFQTLLAKLQYINTEHHSKLSNEEVKQKLEQSDVVILPSRCEGMSMFATEALATGRAFVFTKNNGLKDMILDGFNGVAITSFDYLNMAKAIRQYIEDKSLSIQYGKHSRELFENEYTYEKTAKKFNVVLNTVEAIK